MTFICFTVKTMITAFTIPKGLNITIKVTEVKKKGILNSRNSLANWNEIWVVYYIMDMKWKSMYISSKMSRKFCGCVVLHYIYICDKRKCVYKIVVKFPDNSGFYYSIPIRIVFSRPIVTSFSNAWRRYYGFDKRLHHVLMYRCSTWPTIMSHLPYIYSSYLSLSFQLTVLD